ncbi:MULTISPECIES: hypothetical protein [unclassified Minwuia]|jgi:hypothetical protein|uniref:hypothetical protein n=1 Tax=unclassified Minwuia TaxID=2618799 RepID=UPI00247A3F77|nr:MULTISPECIES: hypothetical protein [unclassified Minwuia]
MAGASRSATGKGARQARRIALPLFLLGFVFLFGLFAARAIPALPVLTEPDISDVPMSRLFTRADLLTHRAGTAIETGSAEWRFMVRMRALRDAELAARKSLALRPIGSEAWNARAYAALKSGRVSDAGRYTLNALNDGPFSSRFAPTRFSLGLRFWDSLSEQQKQRHYALIRNAIYYEPEAFLGGILPAEELVAHARKAIGDDSQLTGKLDRRLFHMGLTPTGAKK